MPLYKNLSRSSNHHTNISLQVLRNLPKQENCLLGIQSLTSLYFLLIQNKNPLLVFLLIAQKPKPTAPHFLHGIRLWFRFLIYCCFCKCSSRLTWFLHASRKVRYELTVFVFLFYHLEVILYPYSILKKLIVFVYILAQMSINVEDYCHHTNSTVIFCSYKSGYSSNFRRISVSACVRPAARHSTFIAGFPSSVHIHSSFSRFPL